MQLTAILLLTLGLTAAAAGHSQTVSLSLKNAPLEQAFKQIKKQTGYEFLYTDEMLQGTKPVSINVKKASLQEVLDQCFRSQPVGYTIIDKTIIVKKFIASETKQTPNADGGSEQLPPPIDISGRVTDENGNPLVGASVKVKGSSKGTTTNSEGVFTLKNVADDAVLEISYVGFESISIPVSNRTAIVTSLKQKPESLGEVTIQKGYYTEKQKYTVGSVTHIGKEVFEQSPVTNPLLALQGRVPGMEITQLTGMNGGGVKVRIQGQNSFVENRSNPLIIIDGIPYPSNFEGGEWNGTEIIQRGSPLNLINPQDIESIDVLKDADATAIYGSRAANGAILITTKKGKAGKTKVSLSLQQGWGKVAKHMDMLNTRQYLDMRYEAYRNDGIAFASQSTNSSNYDLKLWDTTRYTDWQKELVGGTAKYTNINAGISGGNQELQYLVGANYNRQTTVFPGDFDYEICGMHFSLGGNSANQRLNVQLTGSYSFSDNHLPNVDLTQTAILMSPNAPSLYKGDGSLNWAPDATGKSSWTNPLAYMLSTDFIDKNNGLVSNLTLSYKILRGLSFKASAGYRNSVQEMYTAIREERVPPENRAFYNIRQARFGNRSMNGWNIEPQLDYSGKIVKGELSALIGTTISKSYYKDLLINAQGFPTDELMRTLRAATSSSIESSNSFTTRFNALYGRLGYIYDGKYLVNFNARRDGSNKFGEANRFHNFWSAGAGWIFTEENWLKRNFSFLSFGKIRASYGLTGSDNIGEFEYLSRYEIINGSGIPYQGSVALSAQNLPNPYLQWEETKKGSIGLDLGFLNNRINISANYNRNRSTNQLLGYTLPTLTGFEFISKNLPAVIENTGWELLLNTVNVRSKSMTWSTSFNITIPQSGRLISFPGIENTGYADPASGIVVGKPLGLNYVYKYAAINSSNGTALLLNNSGDPVLSPSTAARVFMSTRPKYYGGLINTISYKGVRLDFGFHFIKKLGTRDMYYYNGQVAPGRFDNNLGGNQPITILSRWQKPGDVGSIPRLSTISNFANQIKASDAFYADASFARLENLSLSWQLPASWLNKFRFQDANLYFRGQNLATMTNYTGLDPETMNLGMPPLRLWTIGGQFSF